MGGWKVNGEIPKEVKKCVAIGFPHTSNWDFIWTVCTLHILQYPSKYLIKDAYFKNPISAWFFRLTGGIPVDRSKRNNLTGELKKMVEGPEPIYLLFSPEGTRKKVTKWKSGFYHIAMDCGLPIALGYLDYKKKQAGFLGMFKPTGNKEADFEAMIKMYDGIVPGNPENYSAMVNG